MTSDLPFGRRLARFVIGLDGLLGLPDVCSVIERSLVDTLACAVGARNEATVTKARDAALAFSRLPGDAAGMGAVLSASLVGCRDRVTIEAAAFTNGLAARYLDYNDIYLSKEAMHPSDNIPMALALGEALGASGRDMLDAIARGYEVHCRLADTVSTRKGGWDNVVLGAIAAAAMAGCLLDLDEDALTNALTIAATGNVALMETRVGELSAWKSAACAYAARAGLFAAIQARAGLTGPALAFEGSRGLFTQVTGPSDLDAWVVPAGAARLTGLHLKAYPIQYFTQTAVDAALSLRDGFDPIGTSAITVETFEFGRVAAADQPEKWRPGSRETADHSLPYAVAVALLDGAVGEAQFTIERIRRDDVQALMSHIEVQENPEFTASYPDKVTTRVTIGSAPDGPSRVRQVDYPKGHARNPMSRDDVSTKYREMSLGIHEADSLLDRLWHFAELSSPEAGALIGAVLRGGA